MNRSALGPAGHPHGRPAALLAVALAAVGCASSKAAPAPDSGHAADAHGDTGANEGAADGQPEVEADSQEAEAEVEAEASSCAAPLRAQLVAPTGGGPPSVGAYFFLDAAAQVCTLTPGIGSSQTATLQFLWDMTTGADAVVRVNGTTWQLVAVSWDDGGAGADASLVGPDIPVDVDTTLTLVGPLQTTVRLVLRFDTGPAVTSESLAVAAGGD